MTTIMPLDSNNNPVPALRLKNGGAHTITSGLSSTRNTAAFDTDTEIVSVYATTPVYIKFGGSGVKAATSDHYFPAGTYYDFAIGGDSVGHASHLAALAVSDAGTVYISEKN